MIQDMIDRLKSLQDILSEKFRIENEIKNLPRALSTKTELVSRMKKSYIDKSTQYDEIKSRARDFREQMEQAEREREKYESQMDLIKTQREYEALDKEIRDATEREQTLRKELQREEKSLQEMAETLEREESLIKQQEDELRQEQEKIKSETEAKEAQIADLTKEEKKLTPELDEELLFKFERIIRSKEGQGIVPLRKGVCTGCQMILPSQFVNDVREGNEILFCPYCSKIVFYLGDDESSFSETEAEGLSDIIGALGTDENDAFDFEDVLDEEPLEIGEDDDDIVEEEDELEEDDDTVEDSYDSEEEEDEADYEEEEEEEEEEDLDLDDDELDDEDGDEDEEDEEEEE